MKQYIDKAALVAEIEKKTKQYEDAFASPSFASYEAMLIAKGKYRKLLDILSFLKTIETKEVDEEYNGKAMLYILEKGVKQGRKELIEKACKFFAPYIPDNSGGYDRDLVIEQFKKQWRNKV